MSTLRNGGGGGGRSEGNAFYAATDTIGPKAPLITNAERGRTSRQAVPIYQAGRQIKQLLSVEQMFALQ